MDNPQLPRELEWGKGLRIIHVPAGPACYLPKEDMLPYGGQFGEFMLDYFGKCSYSYDLIHANFFMSAMAALPVVRQFGIPLAVTFHALGRVRRQLRRYYCASDVFATTPWYEPFGITPVEAMACARPFPKSWCFR